MVVEVQNALEITKLRQKVKIKQTGAPQAFGVARTVSDTAEVIQNGGPQF